MSSTPPPFPYVYAGRSGEPSRTNEYPSTPGIHWSPIVASASVSFALVVVVVAWIITHPNKAPRPSEPATVAIVFPQIEPPAPPAPRIAPVIAPTPAFHRAPAREVIVANLSALEEESPPLPPPPSPRPKPQPQPERQPQPPVVEAAPPQAAGESYGTQVLFLNNQSAAADLARRDRKLLFVMHISGNFEDSCFT